MHKLITLLVALLMIAINAFAAVNVNTANKDELQMLTGIGPAKAQAIIDYRTKNGDFKTVDDLTKVPGIGPAVLGKMKSRRDLDRAATTAKPRHPCSNTGGGQRPLLQPAKPGAKPPRPLPPAGARCHRKCAHGCSENSGDSRQRLRPPSLSLLPLPQQALQHRQPPNRQRLLSHPPPRPSQRNPLRARMQPNRRAKERRPERCQEHGCRCSEEVISNRLSGKMQ
jgi:competence protein ComEA